ncbi:MAG: acetolactate synthase large subunit, partial [Gammaproteobacteria bacterium]
GFANLHNARKARTPMVNVIGEHATYHRQYDAPLSSDVLGLARTVCHWVKVSESADDVATDGALAVQAALAPPGQVTGLILPADTAWNRTHATAKPLPAIAPRAVDGAAVDDCARALRTGLPAVLLVNGFISARRSALLDRIAQKTGARWMTDTFVPRIERGAGRADVERLPYFGEQAAEVLAGTRHLILVSTQPPVTFFAYPDKPNWLTPDDCTLHTLVEREGDVDGALEALGDAVGISTVSPVLLPYSRPPLANGALTPASIGAAVAHHLPEGAIVVDEGATSGGPSTFLTRTAAPHDWLILTGGSIGYGMPTATGAAVACPDRRVVCLQADGGGMYTPQALWTQARERLDVTTVIFANRKYAILQVEFGRVGAHNPGPKAMSMLDLGNPALDWVSLAAGMGVPGVRVTTAEAFNRAFERGLGERGPFLIEAVL